jgi:hypothetical protein
LISEFANAENFRINDAALFCGNGESLVSDSAPFDLVDRRHHGSPWFKIPLRLHTVASASERYRAFAAAEWDHNNSGPQEQWLGEDGQMHELPLPENPFREKALTR